MSIGRLSASFGVEFWHSFRRPLFIALALMLALTAFGLSSGKMQISSGDSTVGGTKAWITSEFAQTQTTTFLVLLYYAFFVAAAGGLSLLRDRETRVDVLLHATPMTPGEYVWGRFFAVVGSFTVLLCWQAGADAFFNHAVPNANVTDIRGPFSFANYFLPVLTMGIPFVVFFAGVSMWVGERSRSAVLVFVLPVAMLMISGFFLWTWSPSWLSLAGEPVPAGDRTHRVPLAQRNLPQGRSRRGVLQSRPRSLRGAVLAQPPLAAGAGWGGGAHDAPVGGHVHARGGGGEGAVVASQGQATGSCTTGTRARGDITAGTRHDAVACHRFWPAWGAWRAPNCTSSCARRGCTSFSRSFSSSAWATCWSPWARSTRRCLLTPGMTAVGVANQLVTFVCFLLMFYTVESLERENVHGLRAHPVRVAPAHRRVLERKGAGQQRDRGGHPGGRVHRVRRSRCSSSAPCRFRSPRTFWCGDCCSCRPSSPGQPS